MTLAERRVVHDFETNQFPGLRDGVQEAAGFPVEIEVQWDTLAVPNESRLYAECWPPVYFEPLIEGLKAVAVDMGREALKAALKKIVVRNTSGCVYGDCWATFADGTLTLDHQPISNVGDGESRRKGLVTLLENSL